MPDVTVELEERSWVEQLLDALTGKQLPLRALALNRALAAGVPRLLAQLGQLPQLGAGRIGSGCHDASVSRPRPACRDPPFEGKRTGREVTLPGESRPIPSA